MGTKERKAKEKEDLKSLISKAAKKLFVEKGIEQTTIRNIANEIDYSVGTVYLYFKDKNDIFHNLHSQGFNMLFSQMQPLSNVQNPMERLKALGRVYLNFALENPDMYNLMFTLNAPVEFIETTQTQEWNEGKATFGFLKQTVQDCFNKGYFQNHALEPLSYAIWSCVHGMASLYISQRVKGVNLSDPNTLVLRSYEDFLLMLEN